MIPYKISKKELIELFKVDQKKGLSLEEVQNRLKEHGYNEMPDTDTRTLFSIFISQFQNSLIYVLLIAAVLIFFVSDKTADAFIITAVLVFNAILGTVQEGRAQNIIEGLKQLMQNEVVVLRNAEKVIVEERMLVPGDIIFIRDGERIPADARILESQSLFVDESILTGESTPVLKTEKEILKNVHIYEQSNMVFKGTYIFSGTAQAIVIKTGKGTELGLIQKAITEVKTDIPLKKELNHLSSVILVVVFVICLLLVMVGLFMQKPTKELITMIIALFICVVPEGLPVVLTVILSLGVKTLSENSVLVRNMQAVEALGVVTTIVIDKTGTITRNELMVTEVITKKDYYSVSGNGYYDTGTIKTHGKDVVISDYDEDLQKIAIIGLLLHSTEIIKNPKRDSFDIKGDPTEAALAVFGKKLHIPEAHIVGYKKIFEVPFRSEVRYHGGILHHNNILEACIVGSPEIVFKKCNHVEDFFVKQLEELLTSGSRVLAIALKQVTAEVFSEQEDNFQLLGIIAIQDAIRPEINEIIQHARNAGLRVIMATGDHAITAKKIAISAGIAIKSDSVIDGSELATMSDVVLKDLVLTHTVFSRMIPEYKVRIIKALQDHKEIVAMTGDGVNDAPSLVLADVGIAMGTSGTDVAKQASDILLLNDSFEYIVKAIEEGRHVFQTLKRVVFYFFATNLSELLIILFAFLISFFMKNQFPLPITAAQILWLNLVTDGFLDIGLALEKKESDLLRPEWLKEKQKLLDVSMLFNIAFQATIMAIGSLMLFWFFYEKNLRYAQTITLVTLTMFQWFNVWNCRSFKKSIFSIGFFSNKILIFIMLFVLCLQLLVLYVPVLQYLFDTTPLAGIDWMIIIFLTSSIVWIEEIRKYFIFIIQKQYN